MNKQIISPKIEIYECENEATTKAIGWAIKKPTNKQFNENKQYKKQAKQQTLCKWKQNTLDKAKKIPTPKESETAPFPEGPSNWRARAGNFYLKKAWFFFKFSILNLKNPISRISTEFARSVRDIEISAFAAPKRKEKTLRYRIREL